MGACIRVYSARDDLIAHSPCATQRCTNSLLAQPCRRFPCRYSRNLTEMHPVPPHCCTLQLQQKQGGRWPGITAVESKAQSSILMPFNIWEMQSSYNEKADIWQVCDCKAVLAAVAKAPSSHPGFVRASLS